MKDNYMKRLWVKYLSLILILAQTSVLFADTLKFKNGLSITGTYLEQDTDIVLFQVDGKQQIPQVAVSKEMDENKFLFKKSHIEFVKNDNGKIIFDKSYNIDATTKIIRGFDSIYTINTTREILENYKIISIKGDVIVGNDGFSNIIISIDEINSLELPVRPSFKSRVITGAFGGYCGWTIGVIAGALIVLTTGGNPLESKNEAPIIVAGLIGAYHFGRIGIIKGIKFGGISETEIVADFSDWTLDEKKDFIRTNIIK